MQVSSSLQAPETAAEVSANHVSEAAGETARESLHGSSVWGPKNKAKPGLFAMLLDGLTGKSRKSPEIAQNSFKKKIQNEFNEQNHLKNDLITDKNDLIGSKKGLFSLSKQDLQNKNKEIRNDNEKSGQILVLAGEFQLPLSNLVQNNQQDLTNLKTNTLKTNVLAGKPGISTLDSQNNELAGKVNGKSGEQQDIHLQNLNENIASKPQDKNKNRGAVDIFPARIHENRFYQFTGEPKLAAVDAMSLRDNRNSGDSKIADSRKKGRDRAFIEIRDLRTVENRPQIVAEPVNTIHSTVMNSGKIDADIPVEISSLSVKTGEPGNKTGESLLRGYEDALSQKLHDGLNSDIVKQASVILRNNGEGTIRLTLKPETLGNVKIRLEMTENKITGHIMVESREALRAFERELPVLEKAFRDSGFSETSLDMFLAQDNGNFQPRRDNDFGVIPPEIVLTRYDSESNRTTLAIEGIDGVPGQTAVNILM